MALFGLFDSKKSNKEELIKKSIYSFVVDDIRGNKFDFSELKGRKLMIVNTASKCGFTYQYKGLQRLYEKYKNQNFTIIAFPSNDFLSQEPGTDENIASFCDINYGIKFPLMSKVSVKGKDLSPVYKFLTDIKENGVAQSKVKWNFEKYLIDQNGYLVKKYGSRTKPGNKSIIE